MSQPIRLPNRERSVLSPKRFDEGFLTHILNGFSDFISVTVDDRNQSRVSNIKPVDVGCYAHLVDFSQSTDNVEVLVAGETAFDKDVTSHVIALNNRLSAG